MAVPVELSASAKAGRRAGSEIAIRVDELELRYRRSADKVLAGVNLHVRQGETVALIGTNGAGKSTLLRCLVRLVEPTAGTVNLGGTDITSTSRRQLRGVRSEIGFVFQRFHLIPRLSVLHNVIHGAMGRHGVRCAWPLTSPSHVRRDAMANLERVGLDSMAERRVDTLSGGQQQRVAIARMLMQQPTIVLADEPVASLDPASAIAVMELLRSIAIERHVTVVMALHQMDLALRYADRVVGLQDGKVSLDRPTAECDSAQLARIFADGAA
ncbi:phosphonate ABC transporter ATP-binding protein [Mycobacterium sp. SMC-4]|uniref:phosphonate ABC transporter ATP-binding protein n=1 Tax=Mycobacterium sp. SMC-4 TaxID=2857059 RepID=UPI003D07ACE2